MQLYSYNTETIREVTGKIQKQMKLLQSKFHQQ